MIRIINKSEQAYGAFNGGEIVENKPLGFPREGGATKAYSSLFYWANAIAKKDSTIGLHPHQGFEIMSFVLDGEIKHFDTKANEWKPLQKGDAQIIRSGNGISHSEFMGKDSRMFQIWLDPNLSKTMVQEASYDDYKEGDFPTSQEGETTITHYAGDKGLMHLDTPKTHIQKWSLNNNTTFEAKLDKDQIASIYLLEGELSINGKELSIDDYIILEEETQATLSGSGEVFVIISPRQTDYPTYAAMMQRRMGAN